MAKIKKSEMTRNSDLVEAGINEFDYEVKEPKAELKKKATKEK